MLGVDLGSRRIGLALSDDDRRVALPHAVLERGGRRADDLDAILATARDHGADTVVVGLPLTLEGKVGTAARRALSEVDELRRRAGGDLRVEVQDERLSTATAERELLAQGMRRRRRRETIDQAAATVILQSWLDAPNDAPNDDRENPGDDDREDDRP